MAPSPPRFCLTRPPLGLNLGTYNIRDSHGFGLPQEIRAVQLGNYGVMILTENKILDEVYCKNRIRYDVMCLSATPTTSGGAQGGGVGLGDRE